jgi:hypothetical protein
MATPPTGKLLTIDKRQQPQKPASSEHAVSDQPAQRAEGGYCGYCGYTWVHGLEGGPGIGCGEGPERRAGGGSLCQGHRGDDRRSPSTAAQIADRRTC